MKYYFKLCLMLTIFVLVPLLIFPTMMGYRYFLVSMIFFMMLSHIEKSWVGTFNRSSAADLFIGFLFSVIIAITTKNANNGMNFLCGCCMADLLPMAVGVAVAIGYSIIEKGDPLAFLKQENYEEEYDKKFASRIITLVPPIFLKMFMI